MIDDTTLFAMVLERFPEHSSEELLAEFATLKKGFDKIDNPDPEPEVLPEPVALESESEQLAEKPKKRYTKRSLKVDPATAIREDVVVCCLCGQEFKTLTSKHLVSVHGITPDEYKKLCGYSKDTNLMSAANLRHVKEAVGRAQATRRLAKAPVASAEPVVEPVTADPVNVVNLGGQVEFVAQA